MDKDLVALDGFDLVDGDDIGLVDADKRLGVEVLFEVFLAVFFFAVRAFFLLLLFLPFFFFALAM